MRSLPTCALSSSRSTVEMPWSSVAVEMTRLHRSAPTMISSAPACSQWRTFSSPASSTMA